MNAWIIVELEVHYCFSLIEKKMKLLFCFCSCLLLWQSFPNITASRYFRSDRYPCDTNEEILRHKINVKCQSKIPNSRLKRMANDKIRILWRLSYWLKYIHIASQCNKKRKQVGTYFFFNETRTRQESIENTSIFHGISLLFKIFNIVSYLRWIFLRSLCFSNILAA